jgi:hypothetical protein
VGDFEKIVADADGDSSITVQFRRSQQGFQYGLLLAHNSLLSKKGQSVPFCRHTPTIFGASNAFNEKRLSSLKRTARPPQLKRNISCNRLVAGELGWNCDADATARKTGGFGMFSSRHPRDA